MTLKRAQVVMLPTKEKASGIYLNLCSRDNRLSYLYRNYESNTLHLSSSDKEVMCCIKECCNPKHLYILSDDEIKVGDWVVHGLLPLIYQVNKDNYEASVHNKSKKIIATTDSSLVHSNCCIAKEGLIKANQGCRERNRCLLPQPSEDFIRVYVEAYNKGNIIEWVDVEYSEYKFEEFQNMTESNITNKITNEYYRYSEDDQCFEHWYYASIQWINSLLGLKLKVNSKNEISIRKIKDTWTRDEVKLAFMNFLKDNGLSGISGVTVNKWIEQNL